MRNFNFYSPTFFAFGKGKESETGVLVNASASPQDFHLGFNMRF